MAGKEYEERRGRGRGRGRGRPRGRAKGPPRGLRVKKRNMIESEDEEEPPTPDENKPPPVKQYDQDCDISSLEAPTFTTLDRGPSAPMMRLSWDHPVNLIGEKVLSPRIHICDSCNKPILIYGRMIPCKHVFCLWCAKSEDRVCARCGERVARVEQTGLGTVFMCTYSINKAVCKRTYLSQRDLQAHIDHRHMKMSGAPGGPKEDMKEERLSHRDPRGEGRDQRGGGDPRGINDPRVGKEGYEGHREAFTTPPQFSRQGAGLPGQYGPPGATSQAGPHQSSSGPSHISLIPVMTSARTNLITVPIQDPPDHASPSFPPPNQPPPSHLPPGPHSFTSPPPSGPPPPHSVHSQPPHSAHSQPHSYHSQPPHSGHSSHSQPHSAHSSHSQPPHSSHSQPPSQQYPTSLPSGYQGNQYSYPPNPTSGPPPPPNPPNVPPPPPFTSVAPPPPTTYGGRGGYEGGGGGGQYAPNNPPPQWSTPPLQTHPTHTQPGHTPTHNAPPPSSQSSQYYRKNF